MLLNRVADLLPEQRCLISALCLSHSDLDSILEPHDLVTGVDFVDDKAGVFRPVRLVFQAVAGLKEKGLLFYCRTRHAFVDGYLGLHRLRRGAYLIHAYENLIEVILFDDGCHLDLLHQRLPIGFEWGQAVSQVVGIAMSCGIAQSKQRVERRQSANAALAFHVLRLVKNQYRSRRLHKEEWSRALQAVRALANDVIFFVEGIYGHH